MSQKTADKIRITLDGDWSMNGVTDQIPHLVEQLAFLPDSLSENELQSSRPEIRSEVVLTGIKELDVSGCQLLALFIQVLKQRGVMPLLTDIPEAIRDKIRFLGFSHQLGAHFEVQGRV